MKQVKEMQLVSEGAFGKLVFLNKFSSSFQVN